MLRSDTAGERTGHPGVVRRRCGPRSDRDDQAHHEGQGHRSTKSDGVSAPLPGVARRDELHPERVSGSNEAQEDDHDHDQTKNGRVDFVNTYPIVGVWKAFCLMWYLRYFRVLSQHRSLGLSEPL